MVKLSGRSKGLKMIFTTFKSKRQRVFVIRYAAEGLLIIIAIGYLFYNSLKVSLIISPYIFLHIKNRLKDCLLKAKDNSAVSFKDGIQVVINSMQAGYSIENSFKEAVRELEFLYGKKDETYKGFLKIINLLSLNIPIEEAFSRYAEDADIEEINNFSEILKYAKRTGGNLIDIMADTSEIITDRIELKREIQTVISGKKFEQTIMSLVPAVIILYMRISSLGTMEKLYGNPMGVLIMSVCLTVYGLSIFIAGKIVKIKV